MLRITAHQRDFMNYELLLSPAFGAPKHELVQDDADGCLTNNEVQLIVFILQHQSPVSDACLKNNFAKLDLDEITYKRTKWSLMNKTLIDCDNDHRFFYVPDKNEKNKVQDEAFAVFEDKKSQTPLPYSAVSTPGFFYPGSFCFYSPKKTATIESTKNELSSTDSSDNLMDINLYPDFSTYQY